MIFNETYEAEMVAEIQRIIRSSIQIEAEKTTIRNADAASSTSDGSRKTPASTQFTLNGFNRKCQHADSVRHLKSAIGNLFTQLDRDLEDLQRPRPARKAAAPPPKRLPDKQFTTCNSMLTDLLEVGHFRTIYNIFVVILLILLLNTVVHDFVADGSINVGLQPIQQGFRDFHLALLAWVQMQLMSTAVFGLFALWSSGRRWVPFSVKVWDYLSLGAFVAYQLLLLALTVRNVFKYDLPIGSSIAVLCELCRFLMKNHAFVRSNVPKIMVPKAKSEHQPSTIVQPTSFAHFTYFQFAPTLVYRDHYPRTHCIRWQRIAWNAVEVIGVIFYISFIFERFLLQYYQTFGAAGAAGMNLESVVVAIFGCVLPSTVILLCGFYCLLHAWMNGWAEMLRFGDRQFYKDWWNASSYAVYYRTWNCVVHDWLYTYVYKDVYELGQGGAMSRTSATLAVFTLSAIFHELILAVAFRFFYPVLLVMFLGVGMLLSCVRLKSGSTVGNIFLWFSIAAGNGLCHSLYCMEFFARTNCAVDESDWREYFVPVSWRCNGFA